MRITVKLEYLDEADKSDSVLVASDLLAAFANNTKSHNINLSIAYRDPVPYRAREDTNYPNLSNESLAFIKKGGRE